MIQNLIYGTGGDSSQIFRSAIHVRESNNETIERDLSMYNIEVSQPWTEAEASADIIPIFKAQIDKLPLWNDCCIVNEESTYYESGDWTMSEICLPYKFNKYGIHARYIPFFTKLGNTYFYATNEQITATSNYLLYSPMEIKASNSSELTFWDRMRPCLFYLAKSSTTNGFWITFPTNPGYGTAKVFITTCIDENNGSIGYRPVLSSNGKFITSSVKNVCYTYPYNGYRVDMDDWTLMRSGYSGSYVLKQVHILNYLFPDLYVISGGLSKLNQDIIHIDNNTYIHLHNDIFIKIK